MLQTAITGIRGPCAHVDLGLDPARTGLPLARRGRAQGQRSRPAGVSSSVLQTAITGVHGVLCEPLTRPAPCWVLEWAGRPLWSLQTAIAGVHYACTPPGPGPGLDRADPTLAHRGRVQGKCAKRLPHTADSYGKGWAGSTVLGSRSLHTGPVPSRTAVPAGWLSSVLQTAVIGTQYAAAYACKALPMPRYTATPALGSTCPEGPS